MVRHSAGEECRSSNAKVRNQNSNLVHDTHLAVDDRQIQVNLSVSYPVSRVDAEHLLIELGRLVQVALGQRVLALLFEAPKRARLLEESNRLSVLRFEFECLLEVSQRLVHVVLVVQTQASNVVRLRIGRLLSKNQINDVEHFGVS